VTWGDRVVPALTSPPTRLFSPELCNCENRAWSSGERTRDTKVFVKLGRNDIDRESVVESAFDAE
jgi:hypothetical protein